MANGNNAIFQIGFENIYGNAATPNKQIRIASESFKYSPEKKEEGLLIGGKATGRLYTMSVKAEGNISTNVRPDEAGYWIFGALGEEDSPVLVEGKTLSYKHVFKATSDENLPSLTAIVNRVVNTYAYIGLTVNQLSFSAQPGDYLKLDLSLIGKDEITGSTSTGLSLSPLKPFRFKDASIKLDGQVIADVTSIKFDYNNNLDASLQTTSTGLYFKRPFVGARDIKTDLEVIYTSASDAIRNNKFKSDALVSLEINFISDEEIESGVPYSMKIEIPANQISDFSAANVSKAETLKQTLSLKAIENGSNELITITLINAQENAYF